MERGLASKDKVKTKYKTMPAIKIRETQKSQALNRSLLSNKVMALFAKFLLKIRKEAQRYMAQKIKKIVTLIGMGRFQSSKKELSHSIPNKAILVQIANIDKLKRNCFILTNNHFLNEGFTGGLL